MTTTPAHPQMTPQLVEQDLIRDLTRRIIATRRDRDRWSRCATVATRTADLTGEQLIAVLKDEAVRKLREECDRLRVDLTAAESGMEAWKAIAAAADEQRAAAIEALTKERDVAVAHVAATDAARDPDIDQTADLRNRLDAALRDLAGAGPVSTVESESAVPTACCGADDE